MLRIGDVGAAVGEGELDRLDAAVPVERAGRGGGLETLENVQGFECGESLSVRRQLDDFGAAVRRRDRLDPGRFVTREVFQLEAAALGVRGRDDRARRIAPVERLGAAVRDVAQDAAEAGRAEPGAGARRLAVCEPARARGVVAQTAEPVQQAPVVRDHLGDREPLLGAADRGLERDAERQRAVALGERLPGVHGARNGGREDPAGLDRLEAARAVGIERGARRARGRCR